MHSSKYNQHTLAQDESPSVCVYAERPRVLYMDFVSREAALENLCFGKRFFKLKTIQNGHKHSPASIQWWAHTRLVLFC